MTTELSWLNEFIKAKSSLKNTGIFVNEDLKSRKYKLLISAKKIFGVKAEIFFPNLMYKKLIKIKQVFFIMSRLIHLNVCFVIGFKKITPILNKISFCRCSRILLPTKFA